MSVRQAARAALSLTDPAAKVAATHTLWQQAGAADLASEAAVSAAELIAPVVAQKGSYQAPKSVEFLDAIPQTAVGKPDKKALRARYAGA